MDSAEGTSSTRLPGGRVVRMPKAATALVCFFRRSRTSTGGQLSDDVHATPQDAKESPVSFLRKEHILSNTCNNASRTLKLSSPEHPYGRSTSSPPGLFSSRLSPSSGNSVKAKPTGALENGEVPQATLTLKKEGQHVGPVPSVRPPTGKRTFWPVFDAAFLRSKVTEYKDGRLAIPFPDQRVQGTLQACKTAMLGERGGRGKDVVRNEEVEDDAETSPSTVASESLERSHKSGTTDGGKHVNRLQPSAHDPRSPRTAEQQHTDPDKPRQTPTQQIEEQWSGARRAGAAGRLSTRRERPSQEKRRIWLNGESSNALFAQLGVAISCRKGLKRVPSNQDDFFAYSCDNWGLYGVFDGHGQGGHMVANFVQWHLPNVIHDFMSQTDNMEAALRFAFNKVDSMLKEASAAQRFDSAASGSTASVVLHKRQEKKLYVAYVGDSTVVLARRSHQGQLIAHTVTRDHRPDDPTERSRIESFGGEIRRPAGHVPYRVFVKGKDYPGLAMSRSLGDFMGHCAGVTTEPDVLELDLLEGRDELVIMCTDGVWEFISPHEAVEILSRYSFSQAADAVNALSCEAWKRWLDEDGHSVDDITVQLVHLFPPRFRGNNEQRPKSVDKKGLS